MKKLFLRMGSSQLAKTSALNGLVNSINIISTLVSSKIIAVYLGPVGIALLGQFQNVSTMAMQFATLGIGQGVTKYTAEYHDDQKKRLEILSSGFVMTVFGSVIVGLIVFLARKSLSIRFLHTGQYSDIFSILAVTIFLFTMNTYLIAVLNGYKEFKKITLVNIIGSVASLPIVIMMVIQYGIFGAFLGVILSQALMFFVTLIFAANSIWFSLFIFFLGIKLESLMKLLKYSLMAFTSIFATTFIQLQIRDLIITTLSIQDAGYWQGVIRISDMYLSFIIMTLSLYYLPKLSEIKEKKALRKELFKGYAFIMPLTIISALTIFFLRSQIVKALLSDTFLPVLPLFPMQLVGDVLKIASWLLGFILVAKAMTKVFIITELIFGFSLYVLTRILVLKMGLVGATYAFALNYLIYLIVLVIVFWRLLFFKPDTRT